MFTFCIFVLMWSRRPRQKGATAVKKPNKTRGFRPWEETGRRLDYAEQLGANVSELINEVLQNHLKPYVEKVVSERAKQIRKTLETSVP